MAMNEQNPFLEKLNLLANDVVEYLRLRLDYLKLSGTEFLIRIISAIILFNLFSALLTFVIFFLSIAFAIWIGGLLHNYAIAALITAAVHFLIVMLVYLFRKQLVLNPITRLVISLVKKTEDAKQS
jgi:hypothetical protein